MPCSNGKTFSRHELLTRELLKLDNVTRRMLTLCCVGLLCYGLAAKAQSGAKAVKPTQPAPSAIKKPSQRATDTIGDIKVSDYDTFGGDPDTGFTYKGRNTQVEIPDVTAHAIIHLHADEIIARDKDQNTFQTIELKGNVVYHVVQKLPEGGTRIVDGTSTHGIMHRLQHLMEQDGNVNVIVHDDARFIGPAVMHADKIVANTTSIPAVYNLSGNSDVNDVRFTPREQPKSADPKAAPAPLAAGGAAAPKAVQPGQPATLAAGQAAPKVAAKSPPTPRVGEVHAHHFRTGEFVPGKSLIMRGPDTTIDLAGAEDKSTAQLQGSVVDGAFSADGTTFERATATGDVRYSALRPEIPGKVTRLAIHGTATSATFLNLPDGRQIVVHGPYLVSVEDPRFTAPMTENGTTIDDLFTVREGPTGWNNFLATHPNKTGETFIPKQVDQPDNTPAAGDTKLKK